MGHITVLVLLLLFGVGNLQAWTNGLSAILNPSLRAKRSTERCGEDLTATSGTITLPTEDYNGTQIYRANIECHWTITVPEGNHVTVVSEYFGVELSDNCMWDYVEISEQGDQPRTTRYCGWEPLEYISYSNQLTIRFRSDKSFEDIGFTISYQTPNPDSYSRCNNTGSDTLKLSDDGPYCVYRIQAPDNHVVELNLKMINFESNSCDEEKIAVYSGLSPHGDIIGEICSDAIPGVQRFRARDLFLRYTRHERERHSDRFELSYRFVEDSVRSTPPPTPATTPSPVGGNNDCSGLYKDLTDTLIYSPPQYKNNQNCIIVVRNTLLARHVVQVTFNKFELEDSEECIFDYLKVYSGERSDSQTLGGPYCGTALQGRTFVSNSNSLRLEFKTDGSMAFFGFKAEITIIPTRACSCDSNDVCARTGFEKLCMKGRKCDHNSCENGGTCVVTGTSPKCYCPAGFTGDRCEEGQGTRKHFQFTVAPRDRNLERDAEVTEECQLDVPKSVEVDYHWMFEGDIIEVYNSKSGFGMHPGGVLHIDSFTEQMEGLYACVAVTGNNSYRHNFEYNLVENCHISIKSGPQAEWKKVDEMVVLPCATEPHGATKRWFKDGKPIDVKSNSRSTIMVNGYLKIRNLKVEDAGVYRCEAQDADGCTTHREGNLTVINVKPLNKYCGLAVHDEHFKANISKGTNARPRENPWHVMIRTNFRDESRNRGFCGGTLITQRFVLTAAHCIHEFPNTFQKQWHNEDVVMVLGTTKCKAIDDTAIIRKPKRHIIHGDYFKNVSRWDSDIALIELDSPVDYTDYVRPICIEPLANNMEVFFEERTSLQAPLGRVVGCGSTRATYSTPNILQVATIPYVDRETCEEAFDKPIGIPKRKYNITAAMICAGKKVEYTGDACRGDSGGSLIMSTHARWIQTGLVSWGVGCDRAGAYGVYTNVGKFYDWIQTNTKFDEEEVPDFLNID